MKESFYFVHEKNDRFYIVHSSGVSEEVSVDFKKSWLTLKENVEKKKDFFSNIGLSDEVNGVDLKSKTMIQKYFNFFICGCCFAVPVLLALVLAGWSFNSGAKKLVNKIDDLIDPNSKRAIREEIGFQQRLERYRPYIYSTLKVLEEEKKKIEIDLKNKSLKQ
jgi:hypothetical protein